MDEGEVIVEKPPSDRNYEKPTVRKELCRSVKMQCT
jgi:hypothetical protein